MSEAGIVAALFLVVVIAVIAAIFSIEDLVNAFNYWKQKRAARREE